MSFFAIFLALVLEQARPLGPHNPIHQLVEQWTDRSGRAVVDAIDEQKIAIGKGRNIVFSVAGPTPAAVGGTLTLYK